jgi:hypothetical protein
VHKVGTGGPSPTAHTPDPASHSAESGGIHPVDEILIGHPGLPTGDQVVAGVMLDSVHAE